MSSLTIAGERKRLMCGKRARSEEFLSFLQAMMIYIAHVVDRLSHFVEGVRFQWTLQGKSSFHTSCSSENRAAKLKKLLHSTCPSLFKNSRLLHIERWSEGEDKEEAAGTVKLARFSLNGQEFQAQDSSRQHAFTFTPALSIFVQCETEPEIDGLFQKLSEGGTVFMPLDSYPFSEKFGWIADKYGVSWQLNLQGN